MPDDLILRQPDPDLLPMDIGALANRAAASTLFADYLARKAATTLRRQRADLRLFAEYLVKCQIPREAEALMTSPAAWAGITWGLVEGFKRWMIREGYSVGSVNVRLSTVKAFARLAHRAGDIDSSEAVLIRGVEGYRRKEALHIDEKRDVVRVGEKKAAAVPLSKDQAKALKAQPDTPQGRRDALLMCLLLDHGLRASEVADLDVSAVNLKTGELHFYRRKVDKWQTHRLSKEALAAVQSWFDHGDVLPMGPLLRGSYKGGELAGAGMTVRAITGRVAALGAALGIQGLSAHDCRHYWATRAASAGTDPFALQEAGGWNSLAMPRRYVEYARIANQGVKGIDEDDQ